MTLQSEHPPLTWARIEQLAQAGHDDFETVTPPRARELRESVREHFGKEVQREKDRRVEHVQRNHSFNTALQRTYKELVLVNTRLDAANATLARVRAAHEAAFQHLDETGNYDGFQALRESLAGQPEAPCDSIAQAICGGVPTRVHGQPEAPCKCVGCRNGFTYCEVEDSQPEAPKGPAAETEGHGVSLLELTEGKLAAAKARIVELEASNEAGWAIAKARLGSLRAANARADAAEQLAQELDAAEWKYIVEARTMNELTAERNQLAARVTELESMVPHPGDGSCERCGFAPVTNGLCSDCTCTPEERKVLETMGAAQLGEEDADDEPGEPVELGDDCYLYTDDQRAVVKAELANRAAKAKRGEAERDRLAARVTELQADQDLARDVEYMHSLNAMQCTPEERKVLKACKAIPTGEWEELRDGSFVNEPQRELAVAELANRAAKAKRGGA